MAAGKSKTSKTTVTRIPVIIIIVMVAMIAAVFCVLLGRLDVLPTRYFAVLCIVLVIWILILFLLLWNFRFSFRCIVGMLLTVISLAAMIYGSFMIKRADDTLNSITTIKTEVTQMMVYVRADDPANDLSEIPGYTFGIMAEQNRDVSDAALKQLESTLNVRFEVHEYDGPILLVEGLVNSEVDAILFSEEYFSILTEMEEFTDIPDKLKGITSLTVEVEKEEIIEQNDSQESQEISIEEHEDHIITMYITGIDTYGSISNTSRSDVNILATINLDTHQILMVSTPRDYYVPLSNSGGRKDKLTHAGIYGVDVSMGTLEQLYGVNIDYYFRVNFSGFKTIVDALGGVSLENDVSFTSNEVWNSGIYFPKGPITLNGDEALVYVRERYAFADGDFARGRHQMMVVQAIIRKCLSPEALSNFTSLLAAIEGNFETSMPMDVISSIVKDQLDNGGDWNMTTFSVGGYGDMLNCWSLGMAASVVVPDYDTVDKARDLINQVCDGKVPVVE